MRRGAPELFVALVLAVLLGSYVVYTQRVVRELRGEALRSSRIYARVFRAQSDTSEGAGTQALFDLSYLDRFEELIGGWPVPVLLGIFYVRSHQLAVRLHNEVPGIVVPEEIQRRLEQAGPNAGAEGLALARELYAQAREKVAGVYVIPPFKQPEAALDLL